MVLELARRLTATAFHSSRLQNETNMKNDKCRPTPVALDLILSLFFLLFCNGIGVLLKAKMLHEWS